VIQWLCGSRHGGPSEGGSLPGAPLVKEGQNGWIRTGLGRKDGDGAEEEKDLHVWQWRWLQEGFFSQLSRDLPSRSDNCKEDKKGELSDEDASLMALAPFPPFSPLTPSRPTSPSGTQLLALLWSSSSQAASTSSPDDRLRSTRSCVVDSDPCKTLKRPGACPTLQAGAACPIKARPRPSLALVGLPWLPLASTPVTG
jgi:hypothetical protein